MSSLTSPPNSNHTKHRVLVSGVCLILICAQHTLAFAQSAELSNPTTSPTSNMLWLYIIALCCGLLLMGRYVLLRARPRFEPKQDAQPQPLLASPPPLPLISLNQKPQQFHDSGQFQSLSVMPQQESAKPLFNTSGEGRHKICPDCKRTYADWMVICPLDAAPLQNNLSKRTTSKHTILERMQCNTCHRRFMMGATFCGHDGTKLARDTIELAREDKQIILCTQCGQVHEQIDSGCCQDPTPTTFDPTAVNEMVMGMALTCCPMCYHIGRPGQVHCDEDDSLLIPLTPIERNALPHLGHGPRRKICTTCAQCFGLSFNHCTFDGDPLTILH